MAPGKFTLALFKVLLTRIKYPKHVSSTINWYYRKYILILTNSKGRKGSKGGMIKQLRCKIFKNTSKLSQNFENKFLQMTSKGRRLSRVRSDTSIALDHTSFWIMTVSQRSFCMWLLKNVKGWRCNQWQLWNNIKSDMKVSDNCPNCHIPMKTKNLRGFRNKWNNYPYLSYWSIWKWKCLNWCWNVKWKLFIDIKIFSSLYCIRFETHVMYIYNF